MNSLHRLVVFLLVGTVVVILGVTRYAGSSTAVAVTLPLVSCEGGQDLAWVGDASIWEKAKSTGRGADLREALYLELRRPEWAPLLLSCEDEFASAAEVLLKVVGDGSKKLQVRGDDFMQAVDSAHAELVMESQPQLSHSLVRWISAAGVLYHTNPGQMSHEQYIEVTKALHRCKGCDMLMWGVGFDARLWCQMVAGHGRIVFLEGTPEWFELVKKEIVGIEAYLVPYKHNMREADALLRKELTDAELLVDLPSTVKNTNWDIIIVDAPQGYGGEKHPGRMESIYTSLQLKNKSISSGKKSVEVMVHDASRHVEITWSDRVLGKTGFKAVAGHRPKVGPTILRHYVFTE
ncbi:hypothetical protein BSKO_12905 [Bryopsis sp. KO-2023]|nr:hypothetical protein BSKO_12905 [Bryopsis sp. KO-2023]